MILALPALLALAAFSAASPSTPNGILQSADNAAISHRGDTLLMTASDPAMPIRLTFAPSQAIGVQSENGQWWVLPLSVATPHISANHALWILPIDPASPEHSWHLELTSGTLDAVQSADGLTVTLHAQSATIIPAEARPHSDPFGHRFSLEMDDGPALEQTLAAFYWGTMLPSVVEKTMAAHFPYHDGYVLSTLNTSAYAGSYPAVDHEFQIKGRLAFASDLDFDIVRRMIALQFQLMHDDPEGLDRMPTSVQPDGRREYHVRRNSLDDHQNAAMFPLTADIEIIEECWRYYQARKDRAWLRANISDLERAAAWVLAHTDQYSRVWSDVYYEDQVIEDGRVTQAQAFTARAFTLLAQMETLLSRDAEGARFSQISKKIQAALIAPLPRGYWDPHNARFVDWVDRDGKPHDHLHLVANELPVTFGYASAEQAAQVQHLLDSNHDEFERFPSFVAARIADYDRSEIGSGGPYDLCAAGRYWYWDAAYRQGQQQNRVLLAQLNAVATEAAKSGYYMSERYDMDHVYYIDGKSAHGAEKYYEYPNVFAAVLIEKLLGLSVPADADVSVAPHLPGFGTVAIGTPIYALRYSYAHDAFTLTNLSSKPRRYNIDLTSLGFHAKQFHLSSKSRTAVVPGRSTITLAPNEQARLTPVT